MISPSVLLYPTIIACSSFTASWPLPAQWTLYHQTCPVKTPFITYSFDRYFQLSDGDWRLQGERKKKAFSAKMCHRNDLCPCPTAAHLCPAFLRAVIGSLSSQLSSHKKKRHKHAQWETHTQLGKERCPCQSFTNTGKKEMPCGETQLVFFKWLTLTIVYSPKIHLYKTWEKPVA